MTKAQKQALKIGLAAICGLLATALIIGQSAHAGYQNVDFTECLEQVNQECRAEHNPADDKEEFFDCLEEKYAALKCDTKQDPHHPAIVPISETITGMIYRDTEEAAAALK